MASASYTAASQWNNATELGFSLNKVNSYQSCLVEVFCADEDGFRGKYLEEYNEMKARNPNAVATTLIYETKDTDENVNDHRVDFRSNSGTMYDCLIIRMDKAIVVPFSACSGQSAYNRMVAHEFGHALGWVGHSGNPNCLMYANTNGTGSGPCVECFGQISQIYELTLNLEEE